MHWLKLLDYVVDETPIKHNYCESSLTPFCSLRYLENERVAMMLQNREFMKELRRNKDFVRALERGEGKTNGICGLIIVVFFRHRIHGRRENAEKGQEIVAERSLPR